IRLGQNGNSVRIVLDLPANTMASKIQASIDGNDLVVRVGGGEEGTKMVDATTSPPPPVVDPPDLASRIAHETMESKRVSKFRIVVDAGHGGEDSGARGRYGTEEKDICLSIA